MNVNELFAGQGIQDLKGFLRMHIDADGTLTIYPIGVDTVSQALARQRRTAPRVRAVDRAREAALRTA